MRVCPVFSDSIEEKVQIMFGSLVASVFPDSFHFIPTTLRTMRVLDGLNSMGAFCVARLWFHYDGNDETVKLSNVIASRNDF